MNIKCKFYEGNLWKSGKRRSTLREVFSFANAINLNKTENPSKDALDKADNYAKCKLCQL